MTDATGAVVASYDYDPWGRAVKLSGSVDPAFGYAGYTCIRQAGCTSLSSARTIRISADG